MKKNTELTERQKEVLRAVEKAGKAEYCHYMGRFGGDYWTCDGVGRCTREIKALIKKRYLATKRTNQFGDAIAYPNVIESKREGEK